MGGASDPRVEQGEEVNAVGDDNRRPRGGRAGPMRLPSFVSDEDVGLGDVVKRVTTVFRVKPCRGCQRRAAVLNRWIVFSGRRSR